ncbi:RNA recognition motif domain-containing protein [Geomobilimonas luticola]|uniref:RNA-binding protein n=1 Tax=Geomobilimonas luticola TaxID=1114878 RepID=A0ABS5SE94_9BACT|nr:RNA-binding protein [Geomobilimonas luticola]MBT0653689.1 RNA-binding protein [Geomobilimonas luticola]
MGRELYVGSISFDAGEDDLRRLFAVSGKVSSIHLITDPQSGKFKGCAYVKMSTAEEAKDAIESLDGALLLDRTITVTEARPQKPKAQQPAGGHLRKQGPGKGSGRGRK